MLNAVLTIIFSPVIWFIVSPQTFGLAMLGLLAVVMTIELSRHGLRSFRP